MPTASQISKDPALETSLLWEQYKTTIIAVVVVLLVGGLGYTGFKLNEQRKASDAAALLAAAQASPDFQQVIERYPGSEPAASAYLLLAESERGKKQYAEANTTLRKFIDQFPKHELITTAWMGVAANLDSLGKADEALSTYQRLVAEYPQSFNAPLALLAEVPLLKAKNRTDEARRVCETLLTQYRDSILASEAMRELRSLPKATVPAPVLPKTEPSIPMARPPESPAPLPNP